MIEKIDTILDNIRDKSESRKEQIISKLHQHPKKIYKWAYVYQLCCLLLHLSLLLCIYLLGTFLLVLLAIQIGREMQSMEKAIAIVDFILQIGMFCCAFWVIYTFFKYSANQKYQKSIKVLLRYVCNIILIVFIRYRVYNNIINIKLDQLNTISIPTAPMNYIVLGWAVFLLIIISLKKYSFSLIDLFINDWQSDTKEMIEQRTYHTVKVYSKWELIQNSVKIQDSISFGIGYHISFFKKEYFCPILRLEISTINLVLEAKEIGIEK